MCKVNVGKKQPRNVTGEGTRDTRSHSKDALRSRMAIGMVESALANWLLVERSIDGWMEEAASGMASECEGGVMSE